MRRSMVMVTQLVLQAIVGHEIELRARKTLELRGPFRARKVVAYAKCVILEFVNRRERLAAVRSFRSSNGHTLGLAGGIQSIGAPIGVAADENLILSVVQFEADGFKTASVMGCPANSAVAGFHFP